MIQFLRGTSSQLNASNQVFAAGQPIFEQDSGQLKIGNGTSTFVNLPYVGDSSGSSIEIVYQAPESSTYSGFVLKLSETLYYLNCTSAFVLSNSSDWVEVSLYNTWHFHRDWASWYPLDLNNLLSAASINVGSAVYDPHMTLIDDPSTDILIAPFGCNVYIESSRIHFTTTFVTTTTSTPPYPSSIRKKVTMSCLMVV